MATIFGSPKTPTVQAPGWTESGPYTKESNPLSVKYIKNNWYIPLVQQSWVSGNGDAQLFDPQIRSPSQSESASQSPSSTSHKLDELQQLPVAYPLLRVQLVNPEHPSAIGKEKEKYFIIIVVLDLEISSPCLVA